MVDTDVALARLHLAADQSAALLVGLRRRQEDLLFMEQGVRLIAAGRTAGRAVVDQAEDIRRAVRIYTTDHLPEIDVALERAVIALAAARSSDAVEADVTNRLDRQISTAGRESRRVMDDLEDVADALTRTS